MQILPETDAAQLLGRLVEQQVPGGRGLEAWRSLLEAHATLMRRLDTDLVRETGLARLAETAPVHARGISKLFVAQLDDRQLALLEHALSKVTVDCSFG